MALSGSLVDFALEGLLRLLASSHKTGVLEIAREGEVGALEVREGALTGARYGEDFGDAALGVIFAMADATFVFRAGSAGTRNLSGSLDAILERAGQERDRMVAIRRDIPTDRMRFALSDRALSGGEITIAPGHWKVLLNIDGQRDVTALGLIVQQGPLATLRQLHDLLVAGLIDALEPAPLPEPSLPREPAAPPVVEAPLAPPIESAPAPPDFWQAQPSAPVMSPPPVAESSPSQAPTDDLSALLQERLAALERSAPRAAEPAPSPHDFWEMQAQTKALPPSVVEPALAVESEPDDRLAALSGRATTLEPSAPQPPLAEPEAPPAPVEPPSVSHYLPPDATAPILEVETVPPVIEEKRRGLFGFGRRKEEVVAARAPSLPAASVASSPGRLASFANALVAEYNSGQYGKQRLDERMHVRLRIVDEQADPLDRMLPVQDDRLDVGAIDRDFAPEQAGPYLATLVRQIYEDAERVFGKDKAKKGYRSAIKNALGGDDSVLRGQVVAPMLPRI